MTDDSVERINKNTKAALSQVGQAKLGHAGVFAMFMEGLENKKNGWSVCCFKYSYIFTIIRVWAGQAKTKLKWGLDIEIWNCRNRRSQIATDSRMSKANTPKMEV